VRIVGVVEVFVGHEGEELLDEHVEDRGTRDRDRTQRLLKNFFFLFSSTY
jgi:hypothetical protein